MEMDGKHRPLSEAEAEIEAAEAWIDRHYGSGRAPERVTLRGSVEIPCCDGAHRHGFAHDTY